MAGEESVIMPVTKVYAGAIEPDHIESAILCVILIRITAFCNNLKIVIVRRLFDNVFTTAKIYINVLDLRGISCLIVCP